MHNCGNILNVMSTTFWLGVSQSAKLNDLPFSRVSHLKSMTCNNIVFGDDDYTYIIDDISVI